MTAMPPREPVVLAGSRVVLSIPGERDIDRVTELCQDAAVSAWTTVPLPYTRADAEGFVLGMVTRGWAERTNCTWAIRREATGELLGMIGLDGIDDGEAEIGFWLASAARGQGLMSEAVSLVLDYGFAPEDAQPVAGLGLERVVWRAFLGNAASAAVARRAGFRFEGTRRRGGVQRGRRFDDWQASLLRDDPRHPVSDWPDATSIQHPAPIV
jgi:RimJ/RimL family protein N-acetyltransferase